MISNFLTRRTATIQLNGTSIPTSVEKGCPQCSLLSPFLRNLVVDEACETFVNSDKSVKLEFASSKTEFIVFIRKRSKLDLTLKINNIQIQPPKIVKYIGVLLDQKFTWRPRIEYRCKMTARAIMDLRRFSRLTWGPNSNLKKKIYESIAVPMLLYAAPIWSEATKYKCCATKLRVVQRKMLVSTVRSFRSISFESTLILINSLPMKKRAKQLSALASLKKSCSSNELTRDFLSQANIKAAEIPNSKMAWAKTKNSRRQWSAEWTSEVTSSTITKSFFGTTEDAKILQLLTPSYQLIQILTGHSRLNTFLHRIKVVKSDQCSCGLESESTEHYLLGCPIFSTKRAQFKNKCLVVLKPLPPPPPPNLNILKSLKTFLIEIRRLKIDCAI